MTVTTVTPLKASGQESERTKVSTLCITGSQCPFGLEWRQAVPMWLHHVIQDAMRSLHSNDYSINAPAT